MSNEMFKLFALLMIAAMILTACQAAATTAAPVVTDTQAPGSTTAAPTPPPVATTAPTTPPTGQVLKIWHYESADGAMGAAWAEAMTEFQTTHPGVTIQFESKGFEQIRQTASMVLNSDQAPDVIEINKGNASAGLLSTQGLLTDL